MASFLPTVTTTLSTGFQTAAATTVADRVRAVVQKHTANSPLALVWNYLPPEIANYLVASLVGYAAYNFDGMPARLTVQRVAGLAMQGSAHEAARKVLGDFGGMFSEIAGIARDLPPAA